MTPGDRGIWKNMGMQMSSDWRSGDTFSGQSKRSFHPRENAPFCEGEDFARVIAGGGQELPGPPNSMRYAIT